MYIELSRIYSGWNLVQLQIRSDSFRTESSVMYRSDSDSFGFIRIENLYDFRLGQIHAEQNPQLCIELVRFHSDWDLNETYWLGSRYWNKEDSNA